MPRVWLCGATAHPIEMHIPWLMPIVYLPVRQRLMFTEQVDAPPSRVSLPCRVYKRAHDNRYEFHGYENK